MPTDIIAGHVKVVDGTKKPEDYSTNRVVEVMLAFTNEGTDYRLILEQAGNAASAEVARLLGGEAPKVTKPRTPKPPTATTATATKANTDPLAGGEATVVPAKANTDPLAGSGQAISTGGERVDPNASKGGDDILSGGGTPAKGGDDILSSTAPQITDSDLSNAIVKTNGATKNSHAIRALIGQYVPQDGRVHQAVEIPQEKRSAFLAELGKVKAAEA